MTQTAVPVAPALQVVPPTGQVPTRSPSMQSRITSGLSNLRHILDRTPGRLRLISALCVIATLTAALGGAAALNRRSAALDDARSTALHLIQLQRIQINLAKADANATNGFLAYGLVPLETQQAYNDSIEAASQDLTAAAQASPADSRALSKANVSLTRYAGYVASAQDKNQLPVGASYLQAASSELSSTISPLLEARTKADIAAISADYSRAGNARWWLALAGLIGFGVLLYGQFFLARHMRRIINVPAAAATAGLLVVFVVAGVTMAAAQREANDIRSGELTDAIDISSSRVAAFDAKSRESLTLIVRGSGGTNEKLWLESFAQAKAALPADLTDASAALDQYGLRHQAIRDLDDGNNWNAAVDAATKPASDGKSANAAFSAYDETTLAALDTQARAAANDLGGANDLLNLAAILVLLVGLLAAAGAWLGVSLRLDEYR